MNHMEYNARRIEIKLKLHEIRSEMAEVQQRFDHHADALHDLQREYMASRRDEMMRQAEQRSLDRD